MENLINHLNNIIMQWELHNYILVIEILIFIAIFMLIINGFLKDLWIIFKIKIYNYQNFLKKLEKKKPRGRKLERIILKEVGLKAKFFKMTTYNFITGDQEKLYYFIENILSSLPKSSEKFKKNLQNYKDNISKDLVNGSINNKIIGYYYFQELFKAAKIEITKDKILYTEEVFENLFRQAYSFYPEDWTKFYNNGKKINFCDFLLKKFENTFQGIILIYFAIFLVSCKILFLIPIIIVIILGILDILECYEKI